MSPLEGAQLEPEALYQSPHYGQPDFTPEGTNVSLRLGRGRQRAGPTSLAVVGSRRGWQCRTNTRAFEAGVYYTESDFNAAIRGRDPFDIDHVQLRRTIVDHAMLVRAANGTRCRRVQGYLTLFSWDPAYSRNSAVAPRRPDALRRAD